MEQATAMSEISTTINELLATSRQITESAQRVAGVAEQTRNASASGRDTLDTAQRDFAVGISSAGPMPQVQPLAVRALGEKNRLWVMSPVPNWLPAPGNRSSW